MDKTSCIYYDGAGHRCRHPYCDTLICVVCDSFTVRVELTDCADCVEGKCRKRRRDCSSFETGKNGRRVIPKCFRSKRDMLLESYAKHCKKGRKRRKYARSAR